MGKISAVINTRNAEKILPRAISSVKDFADEIVVVDAKSEDATQEVANRLGAKVYEYEKPITYVEPARNFAISKAKNEWVLLLDADEEIPESLAKKLQKIAQKPQADYFRLPRKNIIFGKWIRHSRWWPDYNIRFFRKGTVVWSEIIHSVPETNGKGLDLPPRVAYALVHHNYQSIEQYIDRINNFTTEHAKLLAKEGYQFRWQDLVKKPAAEFLSRYYQGEGYKDGIHGLALAGLQAFSELTLYLKVWQQDKLGEKNLDVADIINSIKEAESELHYWQADARVKKDGGLVTRIKRKFKLP